MAAQLQSPEPANLLPDSPATDSSIDVVAFDGAERQVEPVLDLPAAPPAVKLEEAPPPSTTCGVLLETIPASQAPGWQPLTEGLPSPGSNQPEAGGGNMPRQEAGALLPACIPAQEGQEQQQRQQKGQINYWMEPASRVRMLTPESGVGSQMCSL